VGREVGSNAELVVVVEAKKSKGRFSRRLYMYRDCSIFPSRFARHTPNCHAIASHDRTWLCWRSKVRTCNARFALYHESTTKQTSSQQ
jgi:hypothetical protein